VLNFYGKAKLARAYGKQGNATPASE